MKRKTWIDRVVLVAITRRAFALSSTALALSSFAAVSAAAAPIPKPEGKPADMSLSASPTSQSTSPTGSSILAQGNALGGATPMKRRLKAWFISEEPRQLMKQAFSLQFPLHPQPRALPWASMNEALGLQRTLASDLLLYLLTPASCLLPPDHIQKSSRLFSKTDNKNET
jgi:hypothetical protein